MIKVLCVMTGLVLFYGLMTVGVIWVIDLIERDIRKSKGKKRY